MLVSYMFLVITAFCWGVTNVLIKFGSTGIEAVKADSKVMQIINEIKFLFMNWKYLLPFLVNQSGSLLYVYALQNSSLSLSVAVLLTNSLTLLITSVTSILLEKRPIGLKIYVGAVLITIGSSICALNTKESA